MLRDSFGSVYKSLDKFWNGKISPKKFMKSSVWILIFHTITSLFYLRMLFIFMSAKKILLASRMITTWYLMFHIGFIFLRLIQNSINMTNAKNLKFNKMFSKFNNLIFISLIFPFALYIPLVYWLLFCYDSNIMLPNFIEISLPPWMSMSSHTVVLLVTLMETTTAKYSYDGNHFSSLIIMSIFLASYFACLVGTYLQYGFWLYPIFHLLPSSCLPFVFLMLTALLIFTYLVGAIITQRFHGTVVTKSRKKLTTSTDAKKSLPTTNAVTENNEEYAKEDAKKISSNPSSAVIEKNEEYVEEDAKKIVPKTSISSAGIEKNEDYVEEDAKKILPSTSRGVTENDEEFVKNDAKGDSTENFTTATKKSLPILNEMTENYKELVEDDAKKILPTPTVKESNEVSTKDDVTAITESNEEVMKDNANKVLLASSAPVTESNEEFEKNDRKEISPTSSGNISNVQNNGLLPESQSKDEKYPNSSLVVWRKVLEKVVFFPLRSNIQKMFQDEKHHQSSKYSNATNNMKSTDLNKYSDVGDGMKSSSYLPAKKDCRISSEAVPKYLKPNEEIEFKEDEHTAERKHEGKFHYSIKAIDDNYALNISLTANKKNTDNSKSISTDQNMDRKLTKKSDDTCDTQKPSTSRGSSACNDSCETANKILEHSYENYGNYKAGDKNLNDKNAHSINQTKQEDDNIKKKDLTYRFRLELFPDNSTEILPQNEERENIQNRIDKNCNKKMTNLNAKNGIPTVPPKTYIGNELPTKTEDKKSEKLKTKKDENSRICKNSQKPKTKSMPDTFALKLNIRELLEPISLNPKAIRSSSKDTNVKCEFKTPSPEKKYADVVQQLKEKSHQKCPQNHAQENISCDEFLPMPSTSKTHFSNSSFMSCRPNMESTLHNETDERINKKKKNKKYKTEREQSANESKKEQLNVVIELENIQFHEMDTTKSKEKIKKRDSKIFKKNETKTRDKKFTCRYKKDKSDFFKTRVDPFSIFGHWKCHCKKITKPEESPIYSTLKCRNHNAPKTCQQILNKKLNEDRKNSEDEKPRYVFSPLNARPKKAQFVSHPCSAIEEECEEEKPMRTETSTDKSIQDCSRGRGSNMKKKFTARIFKFSKPYQNSQKCGKELEGVSKKDTNGTKIEGILTPISSKKELQPHSEFNNAEILQNLQETLVPDGSKCKLYKFCATLS